MDRGAPARDRPAHSAALLRCGCGQLGGRRGGRTGQAGRGRRQRRIARPDVAQRDGDPALRGVPRPPADVAAAVAAAAPREARRPAPDAQRARARGPGCRLNSPRTRANLRCKLGARAKTHAKLGLRIGAGEERRGSGHRGKSSAAGTLVRGSAFCFALVRLWQMGIVGDQCSIYVLMGWEYARRSPELT